MTDNTPADILLTEGPENQSTVVAVEHPTNDYRQGGSEIEESKLVSYVTSWRSQLDSARVHKLQLWNECWQMYRGLEDFSDKEDWQSKIVLPKAWSSVKQAVSVIKRLLSTTTEPWVVEPYNPDDMVAQLRGSQMTDLTKVFLEKANFLDAFAEGLECGMIMGVGIWKVWWGLTPITRTRVIEGPQGKQLVRQEILEGQPYIKAVDPYSFYWLPGSKLNEWAGTIEDIQMPRWKLIELADAGVIDPKKLETIGNMRLPETEQYSRLRFNERTEPLHGPNTDTGTVKITEYFGPVVCDGKIVEKHGHLIIANDTVLLNPHNIRNQFWSRKPPYVGFSPLQLPFRTEGVGLIEMVRHIDKALNKIANLSVDTLLFRLMPLFEVNLEAYENPEDFETGIVPGKILKRNQSYIGQPGITPVQFEDVSGGAMQVAAQLDRSHQEGALVSEIQQGIPRYRGVQSATEIEAKAENQNSFFGSMAADIESQAIRPLVEMVMDLIFQFIDTTSDERVASILGMGQQILAGMSREELLEIVQGDYKVKVSGITGQLQKAEMLESLVQLMNIVGQNPDAWLPYINQSALLRRMLEAFRPLVHDIDAIIADEETVQAYQSATAQQAQSLELLRMIPQLTQMAQQAQAQQAEAAQAQQAAQLQATQVQLELAKAQQDLQIAREEMDLKWAELELAKKEAAKPNVQKSN